MPNVVELEVEGVLLTGGASRRMGVDKAQIVIDGEVLSARIARDLALRCKDVTVLGREPIGNYGFIADEEEFAGPLLALSRFNPSANSVFVASCDLPQFDGRLITFLASLLSGHDAVLPESEGRVQPLCGIYAVNSWAALQRTVQEGKKSLMAWLDRIDYRVVKPDELAQAGIDPRSCQGANSPEELARLMSE